MQIRCPDCVARNYLKLLYSSLSLETKIRSPKQPRKIICLTSDLSAQQAFRGPYLLAPWSELGFPYVQIEALNKDHNFGIQCFAIKGRLSLRICIERSCCSGLREYLSGWVDLVSKFPNLKTTFGASGVMFILNMHLHWASLSFRDMCYELHPRVLV